MNKTQTKELSIDELSKEVKSIWSQINTKYLEGIAVSTVDTFADISVGIKFHFELPKKRIHHFNVDVRISKAKFDSTDKTTLQKSILKEVAVGILNVVGNFQIEEAENPTFCSQNKYGYRELEALHEDEDKLLEAAQSMLVACRFTDFDSSFNKSYGYLPAFTEDEVVLIKTISKLLSEKTDLAGIDVSFQSFRPSYLERKAQLVTLKFDTPMTNKNVIIHLFTNHVRQYEDKFAKKGLGNEQAIYFIIKTYLSKKMKDQNTSVAEHDYLLSIVERLPKYVVDLIRD